MRILVLSKRHYTNKDLISDQYGRIFEISAELSSLGHEVRGYTLSYRKECQGTFRWHGYPNLCWHSVNAFPLGVAFYNRLLGDWLGDWRPDVVWASSDMLHAVLAARWAGEHRIPLAIDLYDNYESFGLSRLPGLTPLFRRVCRQADLVTTASYAIAERVEEKYSRTGPTRILPNAVRTDLFYPQDRIRCRQQLGLPEGARVIGTAGAISMDRGIDDLFRAFLLLAEKDPNLWLVCAGPGDGTDRQYPHSRIRNLGKLPLGQVPLLFASLDVAVVCNRDSAFGRYCFPLKLMEILAMQVPVVAADLGDVSTVLGGRRDCLYQAGNYFQLAQAIEAHFSAFSLEGLPKALSWGDSARTLEPWLDELFNKTDSVLS